MQAYSTQLNCSGRPKFEVGIDGCYLKGPCGGVLLNVVFRWKALKDSLWDAAGQQS